MPLTTIHLIDPYDDVKSSNFIRRSMAEHFLEHPNAFASTVSGMPHRIYFNTEKIEGKTPEQIASLVSGEELHDTLEKMSKEDFDAKVANFALDASGLHSIVGDIDPDALGGLSEYKIERLPYLPSSIERSYKLAARLK